MYTCPNCNRTYDVPMNFCTVCGTPMAQTASQPEAAPQTFASTPVYQQPPQYTVAPTPPPYPTSAKVKCIVGMSLSIHGIANAAIGLLYTLIFMAMSGYMAFIYGLIFAFVCFPFCLVGLILSNSGINAGCPLKMGKVGKILGIIGVIACGLCFLIGVMGIGLGDQSGLFYESSGYSFSYYF